jgi:SAM-dependent methyltransferase
VSSFSNLKFHSMLVNDEQRTKLYRKAIQKTVRQGDVVLDLGTGSGILAFFACQAGAARVYAVDISDIMPVAQQLARDNGFAERISFIKEDIRSVTLPESVDVIVSELISKAVIGQQMEELVSLSRDQFLKPGGSIIPSSVELFFAPVEAPEIYQPLEFPSPKVYNLDFSYARNLAINNTTSGRLQLGNLLAEAQIAYRINSLLTTKMQRPNSVLSFVVLREGLLHGFGGWFSATLVDDVVLSNSPPGIPSWDNAFFPVQEPIQVKPGMTIELKIDGSHPPGNVPIWRWKTTVKDLPKSSGESKVIAKYEQSTFTGLPLSQETLLKYSCGYQPVLSSSGQMVKSLLTWCDGKMKLGEMVERLLLDYPGIWDSREAAKEFVQVTLLSHHSSGHLSQ